ncbi:methyl-accepting chemotaxis protein [Methylorubrum populi]|jgi:methyl-accepting chemotaxis protein|uniref:Methyl-accepting chemotaxis sensory transducer n=1 Tax=Methylorubrum populi (strain ATCC BAA-705 / NCIMB 13946 / BJ001) TaxID=441620 RepID=B1ZDI1_METPB|nr:methyl-accepting chemotaxis protein [Methylorubrum populi]ACB79524.1 methyl-accepting chemotaxis sensory transducer [Methylorubrum populi BJ001]
MLNSWGLNRSLGGAISTILLVSVLSSGAVLATLDQLQDATDARARSSQTIRALGDFRAAMLNQETGLRGYLLTGHPSSLEPYRAGRPALDDAIGRLQSLISNDTETSRLLSDAIAAARAWQTKIGETAVSSASDPTTKPEAIRIEADGTGKQFFDTLRQKLATIEGVEEQNRLKQNELLRQAQRNASLALWIGTLLTLLICLAIGIAINRLIVQPLVNVMGFVERIGSGDLTGRIERTGQSEIGRLGSTLNGMADGLADLARTNRVATADLNAAAAEIRASAQQQAASVEEQFAAVQETAATVDEITRSGAQVSKRAIEVIATAEATANTARAGLRAAGDTATAMEAIREQGEAVAGNIVALSEKTQAIGEIIVTVNDISERTHLLALNAAIEAAAAGEQGLAFTVVASEMKLLADQAKAATVQVRGILGEIQRGINASVMLTEEAVKRAAAGKARTASTVRTIEEMAARVEESMQTFQQIVASTNQQQLGIEQVMGALQNIRQASQQTAAGIREVETASANLTELAQGLVTLAERYRV